MNTDAARLAAYEAAVTAELSEAARLSRRSIESLRAELDAILPETGLPIRGLRRKQAAETMAVRAFWASLRNGTAIETATVETVAVETATVETVETATVETVETATTETATTETATTETATTEPGRARDSPSLACL